MSCVSFLCLAPVARLVSRLVSLYCASAVPEARANISPTMTTVRKPRRDTRFMTESLLMRQILICEFCSGEARGRTTWLSETGNVSRVALACRSQKKHQTAAIQCYGECTPPVVMPMSAVCKFLVNDQRDPARSSAWDWG